VLCIIAAPPLEKSTPRPAKRRFSRLNRFHRKFAQNIFINQKYRKQIKNAVYEYTKTPFSCLQEKGVFLEARKNYLHLQPSN